MSNVTTSKTESKQANSSDSVSEAAARQAKIAETVKAEILAIVEARQAYHAVLSKTGALGLEMLAVLLGQSVDNKFGYPAFAEYSQFVAVAVLQKTDHKSYDRLANIARNAIGSHAETKLSKDDIANAKEKFVTGSAKRSGNGDGSKASVKIKAPKAFDIALGQ